MTDATDASKTLCRLLAMAPDPAGTDLPKHVPWRQVFQLAQSNAVAPLVYAAVEELDLALPQRSRETLEQAYYTSAAMNARLLSELECVLKHLATLNVPLIVLKGGVLSETVYGNLALRPMGDLDILVPQDRVIETADLVAPLGYQATTSPPGHSFSYQARFNGEISLLRGSEASGLMLDVHWHLLAHQWLHHATKVDVDALWQDARQLKLGSLCLRQLGPEDNLVHVCLHAAFGNTYAYLLNLVDLDRLVRTQTSLDWDRFLERVQGFQVRVPVYFGLRFSAELLDTPIPQLVLDGLRPGALRCWIVKAVAHPRRTALKGRSRLPASTQYLIHLTLIDGPPGWFRLLRFVVWPGDTWLAARYGLEEPTEIRRARLWHPFRVLTASLKAILPSWYRSAKPR
jgi:hypothetical protein